LLNEELEDQVDNFPDELWSSAAKLDSEAFQKNLGDKRPLLLRIFANTEAMLTTFFSKKHAFFTCDNNGDLIVETMEEHYTAAAIVLKTAKPQPKGPALKVLEDGVCGEKGPFAAVLKKLAGDWIPRRAKLIQLGVKDIESTVGKIQTSYQRLGCLQETNDLTVKMRDDLEHMVRAARVERNGSILRDLLECGLDPSLVSRKVKTAKIPSPPPKSAVLPSPPLKSARLPSPPLKSAKPPSPLLKSKPISKSVGPSNSKTQHPCARIRVVRKK
jgi:hypothetical protein